jgi:hypothetical protein
VADEAISIILNFLRLFRHFVPRNDSWNNYTKVFSFWILTSVFFILDTEFLIIHRLLEIPLVFAGMRGSSLVIFLYYIPRTPTAVMAAVTDLSTELPIFTGINPRAHIVSNSPEVNPPSGPMRIPASSSL